MKIISLTASNVKRLKAVEITPDGHVQVIGGRNAQGKSSVLDAIWLALGGGPAAKGTSRPIRDGEDRAEVTLDLGDFKVTRTWTQSGTQLKVENADGAKYSSPQGILDALVGKLAFDPLAFTRLPAKDQVRELLALVDLPIDLDENAAERKRVFDARTELGRQGKAFGDITVDESLPGEETPASELIAQIREAQQAHTNAAEYKNGLVFAQGKVEEISAEIERLQADLLHWRETVETRKQAVAAIGDLPDVAALEERLATVEESNAAIRANNVAKERKAEQDALRAQYETLTEQIAALDKAKTDALAKAEFPIDGLSFDEGGVTYKGVPLGQASSAEQIQVSLAIAMALNPKLKVLRIADGSLLDEESMQIISQAVTESDYQLWIERVGNSDEGAVIIEDGEVAK